MYAHKHALPTRNPLFAWITQKQVQTVNSTNKLLCSLMLMHLLAFNQTCVIVFCGSWISIDQWNFSRKKWRKQHWLGPIFTKNYFKRICATICHKYFTLNRESNGNRRKTLLAYLAWQEWYHRSAKLLRYFTLNMVYWLHIYPTIVG